MSCPAAHRPNSWNAKTLASWNRRRHIAYRPPGCGAKKVVPTTFAITNAKVYTGDPRKPWAEAIAWSGDRIVAVGPRRAVERKLGPKPRLIAAGGMLVLPDLSTPTC